MCATAEAAAVKLNCSTEKFYIKNKEEILIEFVKTKYSNTYLAK